MIIEELILITIRKDNIDHYIKKYNCKLKDIIEIKNTDLICGSHLKINVKCDKCGKEKKMVFREYKLINNEYLCKSCRLKKNNLKKYGVENVFQLENIKEKSKISKEIKYNDKNYNNRIKFKKTNIERYGVECCLLNKEIKKKNEETCLERYGVTNPSKLDSVKNKRKNTNKKLYGVEYARQSSEIKNKIKKNNLEKYGVEYTSQLDNIKEKIKISNKISKSKKLKDKINYIENDINKKEYTLKCDNGFNHFYNIKYDLLNNRKKCNTILCTICNKLNSKSGLECEMLNFIKNNYNHKIIENSRKILDNKSELDIYLPELKLAFEFNGLYWHSNLEKVKGYHLMKYNNCLEKNIKLIYIWEDDWKNNKEFIKNVILYNINKLEEKECILKNDNIIYNDEIIANFKIENYNLIIDIKKWIKIINLENIIKEYIQHYSNIYITDNYFIDVTKFSNIEQYSINMNVSKQYEKFYKNIDNAKFSIENINYKLN